MKEEEEWMPEWMIKFDEDFLICIGIVSRNSECFFKIIRICSLIILEGNSEVFKLNIE